MKIKTCLIKIDVRVKITLVFFLFLVLSAFAQKTLLVEKIGTSRRQFFKEGDYFKTKSVRPDTLLKGSLWILSDTIVAVYGWRPVEVNIKDISLVYRKFPVPAKFGKIICVGGVAIFAIITFNHLINNEQVFTSDMFAISGAMLGIGAISLSLSEKKYRIGKRWKIKILDYNFN